MVIPCYNSENTVNIVVKNLIELFKSHTNYSYEIILINDGSKDNTWGKINSLSEEYENIRGINFSKNFGQHNALMAGYRHVTGEIIVGLDDDGEHNPTELFKIVDKLLEGYDYVCADYETKQSFLRKMGTKLNNLMATYMIGKPKDINFSSYYAMKRFVVDEIIRYQQPFPYVGGLVLRSTTNFATVRLERQKRLEGKSGYSIKKMASLWFNGFTAFSIKPLRLATFLGFIASSVGFVWILILLIRKIFGNSVMSGYTSIMACLIFFCGIIMMMLGIIGEYLGRVYISLNKAPQYVIKDKTNTDKSFPEGNHINE